MIHSPDAPEMVRRTVVPSASVAEGNDVRAEGEASFIAPSPRFFLLCWVLVSIFFVGLSSLSAWDIRSFQGRDHVSFKEIADFYGIQPAPSAKGGRKFSGAGRELVVAGNSRELFINGIAHWLAFPVLEEDGELFLSRLDLGKTVEPAMRPQRISGFSAVDTVVLDAGHGGTDSGASSPYQVEKNYSLDMVMLIGSQLQKAGVRVVLTRNDDTYVGLQERAAIASGQKNSIFVSIHFNSTNGGRSANGLEIYCVTPRGAPSTAYEQLSDRDMVGEDGNEHDLHSFALANTVYHSILGSMKMSDRGVKRARFAVLRLAGSPAVLIEGGFLSNPGDARSIASRAWRENYAASISRGILEYMNLAALRTPPRQVGDYRIGREPAPPPSSTPLSEPSPAPSSSVLLRDLPAAD